MRQGDTPRIISCIAAKGSKVERRPLVVIGPKAVMGQKTVIRPKKQLSIVSTAFLVLFINGVSTCNMGIQPPFCAKYEVVHVFIVF